MAVIDIQQAGDMVHIYRDFPAQQERIVGEVSSIGSTGYSVFFAEDSH